MDLAAMGLCIKRNREKTSTSFKELAQKTGISIDVLQSYENGVQKPKANELKQISKALRMPLVALLHGGGTMNTRLLRVPTGGAISPWSRGIPLKATPRDSGSNHSELY